MSLSWKVGYCPGALLLLFGVSSFAQTLPDENRIDVSVKVILERKASDGDEPLLNIPRDLAFNPDTEKNELWVVNRGAPYRIEGGTYKPNSETVCEPRYRSRSTPPENSQYWPSFTIISDPGTDTQKEINRVDPWGIHFLAEASSMAFGVRHVSPRYHGPSEITPDKGDYSFGTCGESRNEMKGCVAWESGKWDPSTPLDFQGPSLWSTQDGVFAEKNTVADAHLAATFCAGVTEDDTELSALSKFEQCVKAYTNPPGEKTGEHRKGFTLGSHLDMLHESPMCMGIAWEQTNAYWVFDGCGGVQAQIPTDDNLSGEPLSAEAISKRLFSGHTVSGHGENFERIIADAAQEKILDCKEDGDIVRYDFRVDHGAGFDDHCDGIIERYAIGQVKRVPDVPSHMLMWEGKLYIADSGNGRIARLDPSKSGGRDMQKPKVKGLGERVHKACTVVWDMKNAAKPLLSYFTFPGLENPIVPSGIAVMPKSALPGLTGHGDMLVVSDNGNGKLFFITLNSEDNSGKLLAHADIALQQNNPQPSLMGLAVHPAANSIFAADAANHRILKIEFVE